MEPVAELGFKLILPDTEETQASIADLLGCFWGADVLKARWIFILWHSIRETFKLKWHPQKKISTGVSFWVPALKPTHQVGDYI